MAQRHMCGTRSRRQSFLRSWNRITSKETRPRSVQGGEIKCHSPPTVTETVLAVMETHLISRPPAGGHRSRRLVPSRGVSVVGPRSLKSSEQSTSESG
eukprot:3938928-Rhodomonas_salina.1